MKKSYKLIGLFWDGKPIPKNEPTVTVFGSGTVDRVLKLSYVLSLKEDEIRNLEKSRDGILLIEALPDVSYKPVLKFYVKRLLQISEYLSAKLACCDENCVLQIRKALAYYYNHIDKDKNAQ